MASLGHNELNADGWTEWAEKVCVKSLAVLDADQLNDHPLTNLYVL